MTGGRGCDCGPVFIYSGGTLLASRSCDLVLGSSPRGGGIVHILSLSTATLVLFSSFLLSISMQCTLCRRCLCPFASGHQVKSLVEGAHRQLGIVFKAP